MRVLNVCTSSDPRMGGGTGERTLRMSLFLAQNHVECTLLELAFSRLATTERYDRGVRVISLPCILKRLYVPAFSLRLLKRLVKEADIIHLIGHWTLLNAIVCLLARWAGRPYVICPAGALPIYGRSRLAKKAYNLVIGRSLVRGAAAHIAITEDEVAHFAAYGVARRDVVIIPNAIDGRSFMTCADDGFRQRHNLPEARLVLFLGRLNTIKGPDLLLEAFAKVATAVSQYHLVMAGPDGGLLAKLLARTKELCLSDRVHYVGYLGAEDRVQAYKASDLLVIPSRQEAMSIVVLEAGACGKPVLITDRCGFPQAAEVRGGMVVPATVEGLQEGLTLLLRYPEHLQLMGLNLRDYVLAVHAWDVIIERFICLYQMILSSPAGERTQR